MGGPVQTYCLRWNNHKSNLVEILEALIKKESYVDCTIYVDDQIQFRAHRVVLAANSIFFQNIFQDVPMDHCSILFPGVKEFEMRALIEYMYTGEVNVTQSQIPHIMKIAAQLEVKGLFDLTDYKDRMEKIDGKSSDRSNNFINSQKYFQRLYSHQHEHQQQQQQQQNQQHQQQQQHINVQQPQQNIHQHHQHQSQQQQQSNHNLHSNRGIGSGSHYQNPLHHTQQHEHLSHTSSTTTSTTSSLNNNNNHHTTITNKQHHYNRQISSPPPIISTSSNALSTSAQSSTTSPPLHYPNIEFPYSYARPSSPLHEIPEHMEPTAAWPIIGARLPTIHNRSPSPIHTQQQQQLQPSLPPRSSSSHRRSSVLSHNQLPLLPLSLQHQTQSQSNSPRIASISGNNNNNDNSSATAAPSSAITSTSSQIMSAMQLYRAKTAPYSSPSPPPGSNNPITSPPATSSGQHSPPQPPQTLTLQSQQPPSSSLPPSPSPQSQQQKKQLRIQSPPIISQHTSNLLSSVYEYGADNNPLKRKKMQSMLHDTPILRNVLAKAIVTDSSHQQQQQQQLSVPLVSPSIKENDRMDYSISSVSSQILHPSANGNEFIERKIKYEGRQSPGTDKSFDEDSIETVHPFTNDNRLTGYTQQHQQQQQSPPISHHHQHASASSSSTYQQQHNVNQHSSTSQSQSSNQKPEWKRYKQYTRNDISKAIECVRSGMSALQASRKYGVPSRTLYDKVKKLGITTGRPMNRTMKRSPNNSTNNNSNSNVANYPYCIPGASSSNASPYNRDNNSHPHHHDNNNNNNNNSSSTSASQLRHSQHLHQQQQQQHLQQFQLGQQSTLDRNDRERAHRDRDRERDRGGSNKSIPSQFIDATFLQHALEGKNSGDAFHAMAAMAAVAAVNGGTTPPNTITTPTHSPNSPNNMLLKYVKRRSCSISSDKTIEHESMSKRYRRPPMDDDDDDDNERIHNTSNDVDMVAEDADAGDIIDHGDHHDDDHVVDDDDYDDDREDNHHNNGDDRIEHVENEPHSMKVEDLNQVEDLSMGKKDLINERTTQISPLAIQMSPPPQPQRSSKSSTSPTSSCSEFGGNNPEEYRRRKDRRHLHYRSKYRSQQEEEAAAAEEEEVVVVEKSAGNEFEEPHERSHHRLIIDNHRDDTNDAENHGNHKSDNVVETDNEGPLEDEQLNIATPMNKNNNSNDEINDDQKMGHHDNIHEPSSKLAIVTNENDESENEIDFIESTDKHNRMKLSSPTSSAAGSLPTSPLPVQSQSQQLGVIVPPMIPTTKL